MCTAAKSSHQAAKNFLPARFPFDLLQLRRCPWEALPVALQNCIAAAHVLPVPARGVSACMLQQSLFLLFHCRLLKPEYRQTTCHLPCFSVSQYQASASAFLTWRPQDAQLLCAFAAPAEWSRVIFCFQLCTSLFWVVSIVLG